MSIATRYSADTTALAYNFFILAQFFLLFTW